MIDLEGLKRYFGVWVRKLGFLGKWIRKQAVEWCGEVGGENGLRAKMLTKMRLGYNEYHHAWSWSKSSTMPFLNQSAVSHLLSTSLRTHTPTNQPPGHGIMVRHIYHYLIPFSLLHQFILSLNHLRLFTTNTTNKICLRLLYSWSSVRHIASEESVVTQFKHTQRLLKPSPWKTHGLKVVWIWR